MNLSENFKNVIVQKFNVLKTIVLPIIITLFAQSNLLASYVPVNWMDNPDKSDSVKSVSQSNSTMLDILELADALNIRWQLNRNGDRVRLDMPAASLIFTAGTPYVLAGEKIKQLPNSIRKTEDGIFASLEDLISLLADYYPGEVLYDPGEIQLLVSLPQNDVYGLRYIVQPNITRLVFAAGALLECELDSTVSGEIRLLFPKGSVDQHGLEAINTEGLVDRLTVRPEDNGTVITITHQQDARFVNYETETDPPLYVIDIQSDNVKGLNPQARQRLREEKNSWAFDVVVIDPGHGGKDPGAVSKSKLYEKDVVLDVGLRLRDALKKKGIKTVMTREKDVFLELWERTKIANNAGGKLFISLHCNSFPNGRARGVETYFLSPTKTERAMRVSLRENSVIKYEESKNQYEDLTEENFILLTMAQANFVKESEAFAGDIQSYLPVSIGLKDRGVDQAGFYVLIGASMPSILVELAFISNKLEEKKLKSKKFRQKTAEGLSNVILQFLKDSEYASQ